jgi:hypothetical protein
VQFAMQFEVLVEGDAAGETEATAAPAKPGRPPAEHTHSNPAPEPPRVPVPANPEPVTPAAAAPEKSKPDAAASGGEVVRLDRFRKK